MICAASVSLVLTLVVPVGGPGSVPERDAHQIAVIRDARIPESSALVLSTQHDGLIYTINDSGHAAVVFVVETASGRVVGTTHLVGVHNTDTEALAIAPDGRLLVADIGDNDGSREAVALYALPQPGRSDSEVRPTVYPVRYSDGPHDAEAVVAVPGTGRLAIVTKGLFSGAVYLLPGHLRTDESNVATPVSGVTVPGLVTDAGTLRDGRAVAVRTYTEAVFFEMPGWRRVGAISLPRQRQGESLAVGTSTLLVGTEGLPSPLLEVPIPRAVSRRLHPLNAGAPTPAADRSASGAVVADRAWPAWTVGASTVVLGSAWLLVRRRQRKRSTT